MGFHRVSNGLWTFLCQPNKPKKNFFEAFGIPVKYECLFAFLTYIPHIKCHISIPVMQSKWYFNRNQENYDKETVHDVMQVKRVQFSSICEWIQWCLLLFCCCLIRRWDASLLVGIDEILGVFVAKPLNRQFNTNEMSISPFIPSRQRSVLKRKEQDFFEEKIKLNIYDEQNRLRNIYKRERGARKWQNVAIWTVEVIFNILLSFLLFGISTNGMHTKRKKVFILNVSWFSNKIGHNRNRAMPMMNDEQWQNFCRHVTLYHIRQCRRARNTKTRNTSKYRKIDPFTLAKVSYFVWYASAKILLTRKYGFFPK